MRRGERTGAAPLVLLTVALVLAGVLGAAPPQPAAASGQVPAAAAQDDVAVLLTELAPAAPTAADTLRVQLRLRNDSDEPVRALRVQLGVGPRLSTRSALAVADAGVGTATVRVARTTELPDVLVPGGSVSTVLEVPVADLRLGRLGVYPLNVTVSGRADGARTTVGTLRTFLPWFPDGVEAPVRLAFLLPLVQRPDPGPVFAGDPVAALAPTSRLATLLAAGRAAQDQSPAGSGAPVPLTWVVDPALLETARTLSAPYLLRPAPGSPAGPDGTVAGTGQEVAAGFLEALTAATADRPVLPLPYADVDVVALERAGLDDEVRTARTLGLALLAEVLPRAQAEADLAWPADGAVTVEAARLLAAAGVSGLVLSDAALPPDGGVTFSAGARSGLPGLPGLDLDAAVSDGMLDSLLARQSGPPAPGVTVPSTGPLALSATGAGVRAEQASPRLAEQRFLVETALIAAERGVRRDFVVAPPRDWDPDPGYLTGLLTLPGRVPWLTGTTVPQVLAGPPAEGERGELRYPDAARRAELPTASLTGTAAVRDRLDSVSSALTEPAVLATAGRALSTVASTAWRDEPRMPGRIRTAVRAELDAVAGAVRITTVGRVTLTSRTGRIPVTVSNDLDQPVRVRLDVTAQQSARLADSAPQETVLVAPGARQTLSVTATVRTSGTFPVQVRLLSPQGAPLGPATELLLTSSAYGRTALGITLAAAAVLLVAVGVRLTRRALRSRGPADGADPA